MKKFLPLLRNTALFAGIAEGEILSLLGCLDVRTSVHAKGAFILRAGDRVDAAGLLISGSALVVQEDFWGNRNLMARLAPGQTFAEVFACAPAAILNVGVVAESPCEVMRLDVRRLLTTCPSACAHHGRMIRNLVAELAGKNLRLNEKLTHMGQRTTRAKLLSYLSAQAQRLGAAEFDIPLSRQQLADYLSVERSAMSAALSRLRDEGLLEFEKNHFTLKISDGDST